MLTRSTLAAAVAIAAISLASPAFAQAFSGGYGTGNSSPSYYDSEGRLHYGAVPAENNVKIAVRHNGTNAVAQNKAPLRPTTQEADELRHGDFYAPSKEAAQQPSAGERSAFRQGDFYAPVAD
jgi:hypothetical protein